MNIKNQNMYLLLFLAIKVLLLSIAISCR